MRGRGRDWAAVRQNPRAQIGSRITGLKTQLSPPSPKQSFAYNRMSTEVEGRGHSLQKGMFIYSPPPPRQSVRIHMMWRTRWLWWFNERFSKVDLMTICSLVGL